MVALLATIAPLLLVTLLVVRHEADRQVDGIVKSTASRALEAFTRIEKLRQQQLDQLGRRFAESTRIVAAMHEAAFEADTALLVAQTNYELELSGYSNALFGYTNISGEPIVGTVSKTGVDHLFAGDTAVFGYQIVRDTLFSIHPVIVMLSDQPLGIVQLGFAIDQSTARS
ncbi:MAG TPA: hypothetical protein VM100_05165, partial [Longimicrobiales bacterium]|nr:hypothetical protein [Longimicrobiales bacterium]